MAALEAPLAEWQVRQLEGIEWMARHERRRRAVSAATIAAVAAAHVAAVLGTWWAVQR